MLAVKGIYKDGNIELLEPIEGIEEAELYIVVLPKSLASTEKEDKELEFSDLETDEKRYIMEHSLRTIYREDNTDAEELFVF